METIGIIIIVLLIVLLIMLVAIYAELNHISDNIYLNGMNFKNLADRFMERK